MRSSTPTQHWAGEFRMLAKRIITFSALALGVLASNLVPVMSSAMAQEREGRGQRPSGRGEGRPQTAPNAPTVRPVAPRVVAPSPQVARPAPQRSWNPGQRHFTPPPPPIRHVAPAPRHYGGHHRGRGWGWRPWAYGAAAAGAVIVGSRFANASRRDLEACDNDFRGFDYDTGTIVNKYGERQICPYLE
jgi:hypothetical protein